MRKSMTAAEAAKNMEPEELAILYPYSSLCRDMTIKRLAYAAAYAADKDYKRRVCRLRNEISEWDCVKWIRFYVEELQQMSFKVIAVKEQASPREKESSMPDPGYSDKADMEPRLFEKGAWKPASMMGMFESLG